MAGADLRARRLASVSMGILLLSTSTPLLAQACFQQAPSLRAGDDPFKPTEPTRLSSDGRKSVEKLFQKVKGRWAGDSQGYFCRGTESAPRKEADGYRIAMEATTKGSNELHITSAMVSKDNTTSRTEKLRLFLSDNTLRVDRNDRGGEVKIVQLSPGGSSIEFLHKVINSGAPGPAGFTEILRRIQVSATTLTIAYEVYLQGGLTSSSTWKLRKK